MITREALPAEHERMKRYGDVPAGAVVYAYGFRFRQSSSIRRRRAPRACRHGRHRPSLMFYEMVYPVGHLCLAGCGRFRVLGHETWDRVGKQGVMALVNRKLGSNPGGAE